jgi:hypothetical protein
MISSIHIEGYRGFQRFDMNRLGCVNLVVGTNNSGKTSVLEALHLLTTRGDPMSLWQVLWRRGERVPGAASRRAQTELDVSHLFTGHDTHIGSKFTISAVNQTPERYVSFSVGEYSPKQQLNEPRPVQDTLAPSRLVLQIKGNPAPAVATVPMTRTLGIVPESLDMPSQRLRRRGPEDNPSQFITSDSLDSDDLISLWDKIALSKTEDLVLRALRFLDTDIERIASQATTQNLYGGAFKGGFIVKCRGYEQPIPIGSFGDGMWRLLAMAIAISQCRGGVLLVDEIDTGLHYSVLPDMWRLIMESARDLDVQVFATTHSSDCIAALASVCNSDHLLSDSTTLHRVERNSKQSVAYSGSEIMMAADRQVEVR